MTRETWYAVEVDRLVEALERASDREGASCGAAERTELDAADGLGAEAAPASAVVTLHKEGCGTDLMIRVVEPEYRLEIQTVPQSATHVVQAKHGAVAVEWVWGGRSYGTNELAEEIVRVWLEGTGV